MRPLDTAHITVQLKDFYASKGNGELTAKNINYGYCFNWAYLAYKTIPGAVLCSIRDYTYRHAFIKVNGKYYDSMTRKGVPDWTQLKSLREYGSLTKMECDEMSEQVFVEHWKVNGVASFVDIHEALHNARPKPATPTTMHNALDTCGMSKPTQTLRGLLQKVRAQRSRKLE